MLEKVVIDCRDVCCTILFVMAVELHQDRGDVIAVIPLLCWCNAYYYHVNSLAMMSLEGPRKATKAKPMTKAVGQ